MRDSIYFNESNDSYVEQVVNSILVNSNLIENWLSFKNDILSDKSTRISTFIASLIYLITFLLLTEENRLRVPYILKHYYPHINFDTVNGWDILRFFLQSIWLITVRTSIVKKTIDDNIALTVRILAFIKAALYSPFKKTTHFIRLKTDQFDKSHSINEDNYQNDFHPFAYVLLIIFIASISVTIPFTIYAQAIFSFLLWIVAVLAYPIVGQISRLVLITLSLTISSRYLWWRYSETINIDSSIDTFFGIVLIFAETYTWIILFLGFFQSVWPLERKPKTLPENTNQWPSVDIFIPTYNEALDIVKITTLAAINIDWPKEKLHIYILDDGNRPQFKEFCEQVNVGYLTRSDNIGAKAGNINQALTVTNGEYVTIFDCDHIPVRSFLQVTMGSFLAEKKLALLQTPHHFYSPDPFERNLNTFKKTPNENSLFYGVVQAGNDLWNAAFFCGSCAVLKRAPLLELGGIAVETVTEDAHTALNLHRKGYHSAYLNIIQASGHATESLSAHIGQRIRWARGMAQVFRIDNPLLGPGLSLSQRLCYLNAMLHFFGGVPRLIFLLAPLGFLVFHSFSIYASGIEILLYALPAIIHSSITSAYMQGRYRHSFWAEIYETVLAWYIAYPTTVALFNPKIGSFNVTAKGGLIKDSFFDLTISKPYLFLIGLNLVGIGFAIFRYIYGPTHEDLTVSINLVWTLYNLIVLGGAISVAQESRQVRSEHRIEINTEVLLRKESGHLLTALMIDFSNSGLGLKFDSTAFTILKNEKLHVIIPRGDREFIFPIRAININNNSLSVVFDNLNLNQQLELVKCTYSRSDAWCSWDNYYNIDKPLSSLISILAVGFHGYVILAKKLPKPILKPFLIALHSKSFIQSLLPVNIVSHQY